jgi:hypothetical protein
MPAWTADAIRSLVTAGISESASLEFKQELWLDTPTQKREVLKDLSGMGNGGAGTVVFGIAEGAQEWPVADRLTPLTDPTLLGRLEDVARAGVRPSLIVNYSSIAVDGGYVLAVDVDRSPLGPYMVELNGDRRYHHRIGTRTYPMSEAEVADRYALALRNSERRGIAWIDHFLPIQPPTGDPWLMVSGIPLDPLVEVLDLRHLEPGDFRPPSEPSEPSVYLNNVELADLTPLLSRLGRWADGFFGDDPATEHSLPRSARFHRDGSIGLALQLSRSGPSDAVDIIRQSRILNGLLSYVGWTWTRIGVRRPVELDVRVRRCDGIPFVLDQGEPTIVSKPAGVNVDTIELREIVEPGALQRASERHRVVKRFADRAHQAFGSGSATLPFVRGELYGASGEPLDISATTDAMYDAHNQVAWIHSGGTVVATHSGQPVGGWFDGVLTDNLGAVLGVVELTPGSGCPDDFIATHLHGNPSGRGHYNPNDRPTPEPTDRRPAASTRQWSNRPAADVLRDYSSAGNG